MFQGRSERFDKEVQLLFLKALGFPAANLVSTQSTEHGVFTVIPRFLPVRTSRFSVFADLPRRQIVSLGPLSGQKHRNFSTTCTSL